MNQPLIYLASPWGTDKTKHERRLLEVQSTCFVLLHSGCHVISPIAFAGPFAERFGLAHSFDFWANFNMNLLDRCDRLLMLKSEGWLDSTGMQAEFLHAHDKNMAIAYINPQ